MREIEKMLELRRRVRDEVERQKIEAAMEVLNASYLARIDMVSAYILDGEVERLDMRGALLAMDVLRGIGVRYGVEFPALQDAQEASAYVLRYGREILLGGD